MWTKKKIDLIESFSNQGTPATARKSIFQSKIIWFCLGLILGGYIANAYDWGWSWTYGRMDEITSGNFFLKCFILIIGGVLVGFGAKWLNGGPGEHILQGISFRSWPSLIISAGFLISGILFVNFIYRIM
jgi:hypothetical protein